MTAQPHACPSCLGTQKEAGLLCAVHLCWDDVEIPLDGEDTVTHLEFVVFQMAEPKGVSVCTRSGGGFPLLLPSIDL